MYVPYVIEKAEGGFCGGERRGGVEKKHQQVEANSKWISLEFSKSNETEIDSIDIYLGESEMRASNVHLVVCIFIVFFL